MGSIFTCTVTDDAKWVVVQQGMNGDRRQARRYHWSSEGLRDFVNEPHVAIEGHSHGRIINLTDRRAATSRDVQLDLLKSLGPDGKLVPLVTKPNPRIATRPAKASNRARTPPARVERAARESERDLVMASASS
jgi:hypothetical protein